MSLDAFIKRTLFWTDDILHGRKVRKHYIQIKKIMNDHDYGKKYSARTLMTSLIIQQRILNSIDHTEERSYLNIQL